MGDTLTLTRDELSKLVSDAAVEAVRGLNTVAEEQRPAAAPAAPNIARKRYAPPSLGKAMKAAYRGGWKSAEFERDMAQAASSLFGGSMDADEEDGQFRASRSFIWPKTRAEYATVLWEMGEKNGNDQIDMAIRAMDESQTVTVSLGGSTGAALTPPQFLQDQWEDALVSTIALRQVPGVETIPVSTNIVYLPRESVAAAANVAAEAGGLTSQDATLAQQQFIIPKQYGYSLFSNELLRDSTPAYMQFIANTLVRNVALKQDQQFLEGLGSGNEMTGLVSYSGLTTGPSLGANGRSPVFDDFIQAQYLLRVANAEADFVISHPRVLNSLQQIKDATGNYLMSNIGGYGAPRTYGTGLAGSPPKAVLIGALGWYFSSQMSIARTVGSSTDATTAIVGQARYVKILERQGIELAFSDQVAFANDQTAARAIGRATVAVTQPKAVTLVSGIRA